MNHVGKLLLSRAVTQGEPQHKAHRAQQSCLPCRSPCRTCRSCHTPHASRTSASSDTDMQEPRQHTWHRSGVQSRPCSEGLEVTAVGQSRMQAPDMVFDAFLQSWLAPAKNPPWCGLCTVANVCCQALHKQLCACFAFDPLPPTNTEVLASQLLKS